uniref:RNase H type-1 domain-containing protein n=1 Tax=Cannabis sativa TaxID=3483 RepID=A0A803NWD2_CANSA
MPVMNGARLIDSVFNSYPNSTRCRVKDSKQTPIPATDHGRWLAPPRVCVHCDAALKPGKEGVGLGFIWRNWSGNIISAGMIFLPNICSVVLSEAKAIVAALKACPIGGSGFFEIRCDCKVLVDGFKEKGSQLSDVSLVINKIKRHQLFPFCTKLTLVKRNNNEIAHRLAKRSLENNLTQSFYNSFPEWLVDFRKADLSHSL